MSALVCVCVPACVCVGTCVRAILNISNICNICRCRRHSSNREYTTHTHTHRGQPLLRPLLTPTREGSALWQPRNFGLAIYRTPKTSTAKVNAYFLVRQPPADVDGDDDGDGDVDVSIAQSSHVKMLPVSRVPATVYLSVGGGGYGWLGAGVGASFAVISRSGGRRDTLCVRSVCVCVCVRSIVGQRTTTKQQKQKEWPTSKYPAMTCWEWVKII